jgi:rubrerythrin
MLKKAEVIEVLANGGYIGVSEIYNTAVVYNVHGERVDTCRIDTAERLERESGYTVELGEAWTFYHTIKKDFNEPQPEPEQAAAPVRERKIYTNSSTGETTDSATTANQWHRAGDDITVNGVTIHGVAKKSRNDEHDEHCRRIARELDEYADGLVYRCPECGHLFTMPENVGDVFRCPECETVADVDDYERQTMWDYFDDALDIEYTIGSDGDYRGVRIMVTCGGPNIYVDTMRRAVELFWWGETGRAPLWSDTVDAIDDYFGEIYACDFGR